MILFQKLVLTLLQQVSYKGQSLEGMQADDEPVEASDNDTDFQAHDVESEESPAEDDDREEAKHLDAKELEAPGERASRSQIIGPVASSPEKRMSHFLNILNS